MASYYYSHIGTEHTMIPGVHRLRYNFSLVSQLICVQPKDQWKKCMCVCLCGLISYGIISVSECGDNNNDYEGIGGGGGNDGTAMVKLMMYLNTLFYRRSEQQFSYENE